MALMLTGRDCLPCKHRHGILAWPGRFIPGRALGQATTYFRAATVEQWMAIARRCCWSISAACCSASITGTGRHRGGPRGVFTNNGPLEEEVLTRLYPDVFGPFEHLFFCWRLTANKPDPDVYRQVTDLLTVSPGQIGFADDSADNVEAALACGWHAVRYRSPGDLGALTG
jgi:hypothetical protein